MTGKSEKENREREPEFSLNDRIDFNGHDARLKKREKREKHFHHYRNECQGGADKHHLAVPVRKRQKSNCSCSQSKAAKDKKNVKCHSSIMPLGYAQKRFLSNFSISIFRVKILGMLDCGLRRA